MSRILSTAAKRAIFAQETDEVFLMLLTITHAQISPSIRVVNNMENITSRGNEYIAYPFRISLPADSGDELSRVTLSIDNVDRSIVYSIRTITSAPHILLEAVLASSPNTVETGPFDFTLNDVSYNSLTISGNLCFENILDEPFPADTFTPNAFPGLF